MKRILTVLAVSVFSLNSVVVPAQDKLLECLGALSAAGIYNTYLAIGSIGDGSAYEVYDAEYTISLMDEQVSLARSLQSTLDQLLASGELVSADDQAYVKDIISIYGSLATQAQLLADYMESGDETVADDFEAIRTRNWDSISVLLGLEE